MNEYFKNIPSEVAQVMAWQMGAVNGRLYVDADQYTKIQNTIAKYPNYFPEETKWNKIPSSVHTEYQKDISEAHDRLIPKKEGELEMIEGEGMFGYIERLHKHQMELAEKNKGKKLNFEENMKTLFLDMEREGDFREAKKLIWKKHYGKYNVKFDDY